LPGTDQIPAEMIKAGGGTTNSEIHKLINSVWNKKGLPRVEAVNQDGKTDCSIY
jgi:hypothetical protein